METTTIKSVKLISIGDNIEIVKYTNRYSDFEVMQPSIEPFSKQFVRSIFDKVKKAEHDERGVTLELSDTGEHYVSYYDGPEVNIVYVKNCDV